MLTDINNDDTGLQARTKINDSFAEVNGLVDAVKPAIKTLVCVGASITEDVYEDPTRNALAKAAAGLDDLDIVEEGVSGNTIAMILARLPQIIADNENKQPCYLFHGMGNDTSSTRPFATATESELYQMGADYQACIDLLKATGDPFIISSISYRDYPDVPPESNGSLPYNDNIVLPAIKKHNPEFWDFETNRPVRDWYELIKANTNWLLDGIHPNETGKDGMIAYDLAIVAENFTIATGTSGDTPTGTSIVIDFAMTPVVQSNPAINTLEITEFNKPIFNEFGIEVCSITIDQTWLSGDQGRVVTPNTSTSWENSDALLSYFFANDPTPRETIIRGLTAGETGTMYLSASRASDDGLRLMDITYDGVTKTHDAGANPPVAVTFAYTVDDNDEIRYSEKRNAAATFCYKGVIQLVAD